MWSLPSHMGYIKRTAARIPGSGQGGKGFGELQPGDEDFYRTYSDHSTHDTMLFAFAAEGSALAAGISDSEGNRTSKGRAIQVMIIASRHDKVMAYVDVLRPEGRRIPQQPCRCSVPEKDDQRKPPEPISAPGRTV